MTPTFRAAPTMTCAAPSRAFQRSAEALEYARQAADAFRVGYCVYRVLEGRLRIVGRFAPPKRRQ